MRSVHVEAHMSKDGHAMPHAIQVYLRKSVQLANSSFKISVVHQQSKA